MKFHITLLLVLLSLVSLAQTVKNDGNTYKVKNKTIYLDGKDVTESLSSEKRAIILKEAALISEANKAENKKAKKIEKKQKKTEKAIKKAEKEQKKAEKVLKKEEKRNKNYKDAKDKLAKAEKKYRKLKRKGKLSPVADEKWLNKLEKLSEKVESAKRKL